MSEDQALAQLHQILARPEFQDAGAAPWWEQLFGPLLDALWSMISRFFQVVSDATTGQEGIYGLVVLVVCVALVGVAGAYLVRALRLSVVRDSQVAAARLAQRRVQSDELWRNAQRLAAEGDLEAAARQLYLSALYALDEHALLHVETNLTNREHAL